MMEQVVFGPPKSECAAQAKERSKGDAAGAAPVIHFTWASFFFK
jgi:hypothetical protein